MESTEISKDERLFRAINVYDWIDFEKKELKSGAFLPRTNKGQIPKEFLSVDRCQFRETNMVIECQRSTFEKYFGTGILKVIDCLNLELFVKHFPSQRSEFHSGIYSDEEKFVLDLIYADALLDLSEFILFD